jgi:hypothetical protein
MPHFVVRMHLTNHRSSWHDVPAQLRKAGQYGQGSGVLSEVTFVFGKDGGKYKD